MLSCPSLFAPNCLSKEINKCCRAVGAFPGVSHTRALLARAGLSALLLCFPVRGPVSLPLGPCALLGHTRAFKCLECTRHLAQHRILQDGVFLAHIHYQVTPGCGCGEKSNFKVPRKPVIFLFHPEGKFGWYLKAPAAVFISLLKPPVRFSNFPIRSLRCQIRRQAQPRVANA